MTALENKLNDSLIGKTSLDVMKYVLNNQFGPSHDIKIYLKQYPKRRGHGFWHKKGKTDPQVAMSLHDFIHLDSYDKFFKPVDYDVHTAVLGKLEGPSLKDAYFPFLDLEVPDTPESRSVIRKYLNSFGSGYLVKTKNSFHYIPDEVVSIRDMCSAFAYVVGWLIGEGGLHYDACLDIQNTLINESSIHEIQSMCDSYLKGPKKIESIKSGEFRDRNYIDIRYTLRSLKDSPCLRISPKAEDELYVVEKIGSLGVGELAIAKRLFVSLGALFDDPSNNDYPNLHYFFNLGAGLSNY